MRDTLIEALENYLDGQIAKHSANVEIMLDRPNGVAEHPDIISTIETELAKIAEYEDKLSVLKKYFR